MRGILVVVVVDRGWGTRLDGWREDIVQRCRRSIMDHSAGWVVTVLRASVIFSTFFSIKFQ